MKTMKKITALLVAAVLVLAMIPVMTVTTAAADVDGEWTTLRRPADYLVDEEAGETYKPAPGYEYTDEGFTIVPADYSNMTVYFNIQTKDAQSVKEGIYLQFRVDDYCYGGDDGTADQWMAFSLWDSVNLQPGNTSYGAGWVNLIRGSGDGVCRFESYTSGLTTEETTGQFLPLGGTENVAVPTDEEGREIYTLEISWTGSAYDIKINGVAVPGSGSADSGITPHLESLSPTGDLYVGISFHSTFSGGTAACTILKYGTCEADASTPMGTDSKEPEGNMIDIADPMDPATVPENQPALLWDANKTSFRGEAYGGGASFTAQGDNSYHVKSVSDNPSCVWYIKNSISYLATDFPVFAMLLRNYWGDGGSMYYCAGDVLAAQNSCNILWSMYDDSCIEYNDEANDDFYTLVVIDLAGLWEGRINAYQPHFSISDYEDPEYGEFDICWMGAFRSVEEAHAYSNTVMAEKGLVAGEEETTEAATETEPVTEPETDPVTAPETVPETTAEEVTTTSDETDASTGEGCGSVIGIGAVGALLSVAAAVVALKKRE